MRKKAVVIFLLVVTVLMFSAVVISAAEDKNVDVKKTALKPGANTGKGDTSDVDTSIFMRYLKSLGWAVVASIGFAFGVGIGIKVFDLLSTKIDEWEEIKKGNWSVAMILTSLIVMVGLIIIKVI